MTLPGAIVDHGGVSDFQSTPPRPGLSDRATVLAHLGRLIDEAWSSFDEPRVSEPELSAELTARLRTPLPEEPGEEDQALADAVATLEASVSPSRPLYLAYIGSTGLEVGVLASALAATYDTNLAAAAGGAELIEQQTLEWLAQFVRYPFGEGTFTSGGMTSNLTAILVARERALPGSRADGLSGRRAAVYCSDEAHYSVVRAVEAAGLGARSVRRIPIDAQRRLRADALAAALERDRADGVVPVAVVATAGTTLTGAIDPLDRVADLCREHRTWMHVDGAYGLPAAATDTAGPLFAGVARADSVTVDAHKWLGVPKSCSAVLFRERGSLVTAFGHQERYMLHEGDIANPVDRTFEYSRPLRSLRLWMAFRIHGADQYRRWIEGTLGHARELVRLIEGSDDFELLHEPMLSTVCFRHVPPGVTDLDAHNGRLGRAMQTDGRVFLAPAAIDGMTCLRACFVNFRTRADEVPTIVEVARAIGGALAGDHR
ncbi:MAG TPA: aminotransferase class V-fold PLP-dependent enzyme [Solirubrobacteraceae bacterium]|nr:aminotransferase class V-fold PLP-dependent enzyme [Solirubrobacteraceae bacterium]